MFCITKPWQGAVRLNREAGENPALPRNCEGLKALVNMPLGKPGKATRVCPESGDLPCHAAEASRGGKPGTSTKF
jgi:hypothetical protein